MSTDQKVHPNSDFYHRKVRETRVGLRKRVGQKAELAIFNSLPHYLSARQRWLLLEKHLNEPATVGVK